ncbi:MAG: hypothetical protein K8T90_21575 [Planctomycetes bacterium]|nr:hypothetical protein [Planctomycetota bacterium]
MRRFAPLLLACSLALLASPAGAQDKNPDAGSGDDPGFAPPDSKDDSTPAYLKAIDLQRKGKWKEAQEAFREVVKKYPNTVHKADCDTRGGENCYMGTMKLFESGPPARRIDVAVMGDGFQIDPKSQKQEEDWAKLCVDVLWSDAAYSEYRNYFNYYYVRLVSKDDGVDKPLTEAEKKDIEERRRRGKKQKVHVTDFNTAIDCKAAGPAGQVMADRDLVYQWLDYANRDVPGCGDDALVIAFAKFGILGMGGGGIANVGRPDKSITVHEFGHAFVGLLDEYQNAAGPPPYAIRAANATSDPKFIPWQHFLDKKVPGVGVFEGGATYKTGVWRPAQGGCAMNSAGATGGYCPVCREAAVLCFYGYLSPIDQTSPAPDTERGCTAGDGTTISITPLKPMTHSLQVEWFFDRIPDSEPGPQAVAHGGETSDNPVVGGIPGWMPGPRLRDRDPILYEMAPLGVPGDEYARTDKTKDHFLFDVAKLPPGRYVVTARVFDPTEWVLKDPKHLLEERAAFWYTVSPKKK